jgi:hypothetical protein
MCGPLANGNIWEALITGGKDPGNIPEKVMSGNQDTGKADIRAINGTKAIGNKQLCKNLLKKNSPA